ncbi:MAG: hypothetical protein ACYSWQ_29650 [Planctomycetota bacterium]|jgi:hypothetical protein
MNARIRPILLLAGISALIVFDQQPCRGGIKKFRDAHTNIMRQAREQITVRPEVEREIPKPRLPDTAVVQPAAAPTRRVRLLTQQIDGLLAERPTDPSEIAALKEELDQVAGQEDARLAPSLHRSLAEKLEIAHSYAEAIDRLQRTYQANLDDLEKNYEATADTGQAAESRFNASFIANIVVILGLVTRIGNISSSKLDRQLKLLQIAEKKAQLEQDGITLD